MIKREEALKDLGMFERDMIYDSVRGSFKFKRVECANKIDVMIDLNALGINDEQIKTDGTGFEIDIVVDDPKTAAALAATLKAAGFNFPGAKDVSAATRSTGGG